jgi:hypothetical protein
MASLMSVAFLAAACSGPGEPAASRTFDVIQFHTMLNQEMTPSTSAGDVAPCAEYGVVKTGYGAIIRGCPAALSALR